ncbi:type II toxin-antitoxin system RelB/DinJ family antitoxin [Candidatus Saccharibacteria bacterium]|nr:type II toxin-antitoxin system RelB/DinJ family antitoxin [Candidatus Saccharibacteria bacterium]
MATYSIRMDDGLKAQFDALCNNIGLSASTAFNIFARKAVSNRALPIELSENTIDPGAVLSAMSESREAAVKSGANRLSLDEVNAEIDEYRKERKAKK